METFSQIALPAELQQSLAHLKYTHPTPIQAQAIPHALEGKDVMGLAATGTGKTAAFGVPLVNRLIREPDSKALILAPTRELAAQIFEVIKGLTYMAPQIKPVLVVGGARMSAQIRHVQTPSARVLVATPGRLNDLIKQGRIQLKNVKVLVLDEADRMLDMGFAPQLEIIRRLLPEQRQTLLFSATMPREILDLTTRYLKNPVKVSVETPGGQVVNERIEQDIIKTTSTEKNGIVLDQLIARKGSVLIFTRTKSRTDRLARFLFDHGVEVARIHGDRSQGQRNAALQGFRNGAFRVLVATDIAARGIDISHIAHVVNYDLPMTPEDYVHRVGRTARGSVGTGKALSLLTEEDAPLWARICRAAGMPNTAFSAQETRFQSSRPAPARQGGGAGGGGARRGGFSRGPSRGADPGRSEQPRFGQRVERAPRADFRDAAPSGGGAQGAGRFSAPAPRGIGRAPSSGAFGGRPAFGSRPSSGGGPRSGGFGARPASQGFKGPRS